MSRQQARKRDEIIRAGLYAALLLGAGIWAWITLGTNESFGATPIATPGISCVVPGTPVSGEVFDPLVTGCVPAGTGTPIAAGGLQVTLALSSDRAAPQNIVVTVQDAGGNPVDDAAVTLVNRHLEMNHGDFVRELVHDRDGRYLGERVGMGMGGWWQTEIQVKRPGEAAVTFIFEVRLKGLGE